MNYRITIIGAGNVAWHLSQALQKAGHEILQILCRTAKPARILSQKLNCGYSTDIKKINPLADIVLICVNDDQIQKVANQISAKNKIVLHTSGGIGMNVLKSTSKQHGVLYVQLPFTKSVKLDLNSSSVFIQGSDALTRNAIKKLSKAISKKVYEVNDDQRKVIHIAAVFANNFVHHLYVMAEQLLNEKELPNDILKSLARQEFSRLLSGNNLKKLQTGPARRGEKILIADHLKYLKTKPEYQKMYKMMSQSIQNLHKE